MLVKPAVKYRVIKESRIEMTFNNGRKKLGKRREKWNSKKFKITRRYTISCRSLLLGNLTVPPVCSFLEFQGMLWFVNAVTSGSHLYSCPILMKLEFSRQSVEKYSNINFHENPFNGSRVACGQTDMTTLIVAFRNFANVPKNEQGINTGKTR